MARFAMGLREMGWGAMGRVRRLAAVAALAACTSPSGLPPAGLREAGPGEAANCRLLTRITGRPAVYGPLLGPQGLAYARGQVLEEAARAGADTLVFDPVSPGAEVYELRAAAYRCRPA